MSLSGLQKYALRTAYRYARPRVPRAALQGFYAKNEPPRNAAEILGRSIERMIERGLMVGFGRRTAEKWFIETIQLTPQGRRIARDLLGRQAQLPLK
jgi:hypothetical protein